MGWSVIVGWLVGGFGWLVGGLIGWLVTLEMDLAKRQNWLIQVIYKAWNNIRLALSTNSYKSLYAKRSHSFLQTLLFVSVFNHFIIFFYTHSLRNSKIYM